MKIEIERHGKWETIHATRVKVQVMDFGTLIEVNKTNYPVFPHQRFFITDDDEMSLVPVMATQGGPKPKYKQGKLEL